jgi:branched-chain amino acid aminotransferase
MKSNRNIRYFFLNGELLKAEDAKVLITTPALKYGASVFEGIRAYWNDKKEDLYVFRLRDHLKRLEQSCRLMRFDITEDMIEGLSNSIIELLRVNDVRQDVHIRPMVYLEGEGPLESVGPVGIAVSLTLIERWFGGKPGLSCSVSSWSRISDHCMPPRIKCAANYQNSRLALVQAKRDGYDSTILLNERGKVSEGPGYTFFMIRRGIPVTPKITDDILESFTRLTVIQLLTEFHGLKVIEREIDRTELYLAEEAFFCGTGAEITPIFSIDKYIISGGTIGRITELTRKTYFAMVKGDLSEHAEWRTPVYR